MRAGLLVHLEASEVSAELVRVSPSQIQLYRLCARKWAFAYVLGLREPETRQLALGSHVHSILEAYLLGEAVPDPNETWAFGAHLRAEIVNGSGSETAEAVLAVTSARDLSATYYPGKIALNMMPEGLFPAPGIGHVEYDFEFVDRGVVWNGLLDWHTFNETAPTPPEFAGVPGAAERGLIVVIDHKTSSDPAKWGKLGVGDEAEPDFEERDLSTDAQAIIYARAMLDRYGPANVELHWNYGCTDAKPAKSRVATARMVPGEVYARFENDIVPLGQVMRKHRLAETNPLSLAPSPDACFAFHKHCPHAKACNLTTSERLGNIIMGNPLIDGLLAQAGATPAAPTMPAPVAGAAVNPPEAAQAPTPPTPPVAAAAAAPTPPAAAPTTPKAPKAPKMPAPKAAPAPKTATAPAPPAASSSQHVTQVTPKSAADGSIEAAVEWLKQMRSVDPKLADVVADRIAHRIAEKLLP